MTRRLAALLALLSIACRPGSESGPASGGAISVEPTGGGEPASEGTETGAAIEPPPPERGPEPPADATACELTCADVHGCVFADNPDRLAATTIELGCLDACVRAPQAFGACERPDSSTDACVDFLACARGAWPSGERPSTIVDAPPDGCRLACHAFARCRDSPVEAAEHCAELCREALDEEQQRMAAECAKPDDCGAVESCINDLPGA